MTDVTPIVINEILSHCADDGHGLWPPRVCQNWKLPKSVWEEVLRCHESGAGKWGILNEDGNPVAEMDAVYSLDLLRWAWVKIGRPPIHGKLGRGSQAREYTKALRAWVELQS